MKRSSTRRQILILPVLTLIMILLAACTPATPAPVVPTSVVSPEVITQVPSQAPEVVATDNPIVATSRGPNLEATNPATVNLASGQLQLVEFFRFT